MTNAPMEPNDFTRLLLAVASTVLDDTAALMQGRLPDGWPSAMIPPSPVSILGGFKMGANVTAVFLYPPTAEQPLAEYAALLEKDGWTLPDRHPAGGFASSRLAMLSRETSLAIVRRPTSDLADKSLVVSLTASPERSARDHALTAREHALNWRLDVLKVPRLQPPGAVRSDAGGGGGGSSGGSFGDARVTHHTQVTTDLSPAELLPLYVSQLADAGWTTGTMHATSENAVQWLEAIDARGRTWRGLIVVYFNDAASEVFIHMATAGERREPRLRAR